MTIREVIERAAARIDWRLDRGRKIHCGPAHAPMCPLSAPWGLLAGQALQAAYLYGMGLRQAVLVMEAAYNPAPPGAWRHRIVRRAMLRAFGLEHAQEPRP